jgi:hypothetical protein
MITSTIYSIQAKALSQEKCVIIRVCVDITALLVKFMNLKISYVKRIINVLKSELNLRLYLWKGSENRLRVNAVREVYT